MTDLSALSDAQLQALYDHPSTPAGNDMSKMSDADLKAAYDKANTGYLEDAGKSIASGLGNAAIGTLGLPGDITNLGAKGIEAAANYISGKLGYEPYHSSGDSILNKIPTSADIRATVTDPIVSPDYQPQYGVNKVLKTGAEFLPAMAGGPESLGTKFLTRVAIPAAATETAGALTEGTAAEPYARGIAALASSAGASKLADAFRTRNAVAAATPTLAEVENAASNSYDALTSRNVATPIPQSALDNLANDITTTLNNKGIRPSNAGSIHSAVDELRSPATAGAADVADLVAARESIKEQLKLPDSNKTGAFIALNKIENAIEKNSPGTMAALKEADKNWSAMRANEALDKGIAKADLQAAGNDSGMNIGNKIRQKVTQLLTGPEARYLSAETKADLERVVRGTATQNVVRRIDRLLGGGGGLGMMLGGVGAGYEQGGWEGALAGGLAAHGLRTAFNRSVMQSASRAAQNIRNRSPIGQVRQAALSLPPASNPLLAGILPALLGAKSGQ